MKNPFQFGRELGTDELVDREDEVRLVVRAIEEGGKLFLIGPRRYGKTSIVKTAEEAARRAGAVVLRFDAEAYPTFELLVQEILARAAAELAGNIKKAGEWVRRFFGRLQPSVDYNVLEQSWSVSIRAAEAKSTQIGLLIHALDGLERLAEESGHRIAVIIDEFQHIVQQEGLAAEQQIRAAIQKHRHVAYVFAGSKTRFLADMTGDASRPFYRLGERRFIGPIPREDFRPFLRSGFEDAGMEVESEAVEAILDAAENVPYNVQRLAHSCWNRLRDQPDQQLSPSFVQATLERVVRQDDPFYTQLWNGLAKAQQKALLAVVRERGANLYTRDAMRTAGLGQSTLQTALAALERVGILRVEEEAGSTRYRFEDPFFAAWIRLVLPPSVVRKERR